MDQDMLAQDAQLLWADMLDEVRAQGNAELLAWLERAEAASFDGSVMRLRTRQKWAARNLSGKYRAAVEALMAQITMEPVSLEVGVEDGAAQGPTAAPAGAPLMAQPSPMQGPAARPDQPGAQPAAAQPACAVAGVSTPVPAAQTQPQDAAVAQQVAGPADAEPPDAAVSASPATSQVAGASPQVYGQDTGVAGLDRPIQPLPVAQVPQTPALGSPEAPEAPCALMPQAAPEPPFGTQPQDAQSVAEVLEASEAPSGAAAPAAAEALSAAAAAGRAAAQGRAPIVRRSLTNHALLEKMQQQAAQQKSFQQGVSTPVETVEAGERPAQTPIPVLEEGTEQKDEVKAQSSTDFTFDTYVVGDSNVMAYRVARGVAEQPDGSLFNPVFIWGPSGNGKTHLMLAIQAYITANQPRTRVEYISADMFLTRYIDEVHNQKLRGSAVLKDMNDIDVLLVDDVQEFKNQQQETVGALFNIFNSFMLAGNKQIVLAADRAPDYLDLDPRLKTRFSQGMVQDIKAPTWEMKLSILKSFYERYRARNGMSSVRIDDAGFKEMAQRCPDNPRQMTGLINSIMFNAERDPSVLTPEGIAAFIDSQYNVASVITLDKIMAAVTKEYGVTLEQVTSRSRTAAIKEARQVYMWLASQLTDETYQSIGDVVGLNHSTITHGIKVINEKRNADHTYARLLEDFKNRLCNESK